MKTFKDFLIENAKLKSINLDISDYPNLSSKDIDNFVDTQDVVTIEDWEKKGSKLILQVHFKPTVTSSQISKLADELADELQDSVS